MQLPLPSGLPPAPSVPPPPDGRGNHSKEAALRHRLFLALLPALFFTTPGWGKDKAEPAERGSVTIERHHTTNALQSPFERSDWYTRIRGSVGHATAHERGRTLVNVEAGAKRYDNFGIADEADIGLSSETTLRLSPNLELRGTLSLAHAVEGDTIFVDDLLLGSTTAKTMAAGALQAGIDFGDDYALVLESAVGAERPSATRFEAELIEPVRLEPERERASLSATLRRTQGAWVLAGSAGTSFIRARIRENAGLALSSAMHSAGGRMEWRPHDKIAFGASTGVQWLRAESGIVDMIRPSYELAFRTPLALEASLRGRLEGRFETTDTDDPLASRLRRAELEIERQFGPRLSAGLGVFDQRKDNLVLGNSELERGAYARLGWQASERIGYFLRVDASRKRFTIIDLEQNVIDAMIGVTATF